ncbi:MAG: hypothetical protein WC764_03235 [Candidatus Paceibacterota bacterium]|jgi:hypothetical protein
MRVVKETSTTILLKDYEFIPMLMAVIMCALAIFFVWFLSVPGQFKRPEIWASLLFVSAYAFALIWTIEMLTFEFDKSQNKLIIIKKKITKKTQKSYTITDIEKIWTSQYEGQRRKKGDMWSVYLLLKSGNKVPLTPGLSTNRVHPLYNPKIPKYVGRLAKWLQVPLEEGKELGVKEALNKSYDSSSHSEEEA